MMIKPALATLLALLCLLLVKANIDTFRTAPPRQEAETTPLKKGPSKKISPQQPINLNPTLSPQLPDLNSRYLFNAERFLATVESPSAADNGSDQHIRLEDVIFNGAILSEGYKKALVYYNPGQKQDVRATRGGPQIQTAGRAKTIQLAIGDELGGYTVKEIAPDFILFVKGSDTIKKILFDTDKTRHQVTPQPTPPPSSPRTSSGVAPSRRITPTTADKP